jgi:carbamoyltransferase
MKVLGINDGHNASACLYEDGRVVAALQEERLRRVKNWAGMPTHAIAKVLELARTSPAEVDAVALNGHYVAFPMTREQLMHEYRTINDFGVTLRRTVRRALKGAAQLTPLYEAYRARRSRRRMQPLVDAGFPRDRITLVDHHTAHAAAAYYGWANFDRDVLVLTCDGAGDGVCATVSVARHGTIRRLHTIKQADSIGNVYAMVTYLMGMVPLEHEYKLMGLAPYADPRGAERVFQELQALIRFNPDNPLVWERAPGCPETYLSYRFFKQMLERQRFDWIAGGVQRFTEYMLTEWVRSCVTATGIGDVALGGGVFMNVKVNKLIMELPEVQRLFVYPTCGDETNAMGAAYAVYAKRAGVDTMKPVRDLYWGPEFTDDDVEAALRQFKFSSPVQYQRISPIEPRVAALLAEGRVVARFKGKEEFGARALGNRSILANPRDPAVIREINEAIKARDFWMPFAASIIAERDGDYLVNPKQIPAPYMILSFDTTTRWSDIRAGIHPFDRTVRPQAVSADWNPAYYALLREFEKLTGIGAVLNTSFNLHGYPIVSRPEDALDVFDRSGLTQLAIGNWLVSKQ